MPESVQYKFTFQELAALMVQSVGLKEGLWGVYVNFGIAAANAGASAEDLKPTAMVPIMGIGLQQFPEPSNLAVDAAEVAGRTNRGSSSPTKSRRSTKRRAESVTA